MALKLLAIMRVVAIALAVFVSLGFLGYMVAHGPLSDRYIPADRFDPGR